MKIPKEIPKSIYKGVTEYTTIFFIVDYYRNKYNGYRVFKYLTLLITLPEDYENIIVVNYVYLITNF